MGSSVSAAKKRERVERAHESVTLKQGHERDGKGLKPRVERLQGAFPADSVPKRTTRKSITS